MDGDAPASLKRVVKEMRYCAGGAEKEDTRQLGCPLSLLVNKASLQRAAVEASRKSCASMLLGTIISGDLIGPYDWCLNYLDVVMSPFHYLSYVVSKAERYLSMTENTQGDLSATQNTPKTLTSPHSLILWYRQLIAGPTRIWDQLAPRP